MKHLLAAQGQAVLAALLRQGPLLAFDFDGTLAPIVSRPDQARISKSVAARLKALTQYLPVAIITGRAIEDVQERLGFEPHYIVGNHGAEDAEFPAEQIVLRQALDPMRAGLAALGHMFSQMGVLVEDKGQSIAFHYRLSGHPQLARSQIADFIAGQGDLLRVFSGKMVVNVVPANAPNKADALRALVGRSSANHAFFAGDDVNDEPVFESAPASWLTVRIGRVDPRSQAMFYLYNPSEMARLLDHMLAHLKE
jgi:trehalose 6-phosphate phosphatase